MSTESEAQAPDLSPVFAYAVSQTSPIADPCEKIKAALNFLIVQGQVGSYYGGLLFTEEPYRGKPDDGFCGEIMKRGIDGPGCEMCTTIQINPDLTVELVHVVPLDTKGTTKKETRFDASEMDINEVLQRICDDIISKNGSIYWEMQGRLESLGQQLEELRGDGAVA